MNTLLKLPFNKDFLESATMLSFAVRAMRYCVTAFVTMGLFPLLFRIGDKIFKKRKAET